MTDTSLPAGAASSRGRRPAHGRPSTRSHQAARPKQQVTVHLDAAIVAELRRRAEREHLSVSAVANLLFVEALRAGVEHEHGALLEQVITRTLEQRLGASRR